MSVTIDTECDKSPNWSNSSPLTFNSIYDAIPNKLQPLFEAYSIKPTYFLPLWDLMGVALGFA